MSDDKKFSVLFLAAGKADDYKLSGKFRVYNYIPYLREMGCSVRAISWNRNYSNLSESIKDLQRNRALRADSLWKFLKITTILLLTPFFNIVFIQRVRLPIRILRILKILNRNLIYDFDDALFSPHTALGVDEWSNENATEIRRKFDEMIYHYRLVIAGNKYLSEVVKITNPSVIVIPTPVDTNWFKPLPVEKINSIFTIGWVGVGEQHLEHLRLLKEPLSKLSQDGQILFKLIGSMNSVRMRELFKELMPNMVEFIDFIPQDKLVAEICKFDVGLMPLVDEEWSRGKCGYKALIYMSCEVPTIASPVGVNSDIIKHGENGFLASSADEWYNSLTYVRDNLENTKKIAQQGRVTVKQFYSQEACRGKLFHSLRELV